MPFPFLNLSLATAVMYSESMNANCISTAYSEKINYYKKENVCIQLTLSMSNMLNIPLKKSNTSLVSSSVCLKSRVFHFTINEKIFLYEANNRSSQNTTDAIIKVDARNRSMKVCELNTQIIALQKINSK